MATNGEVEQIARIIQTLKDLPSRIASARDSGEGWLSIYEIKDWACEYESCDPLAFDVVAAVLWQYCLLTGKDVCTGTLDFFPPGKKPYRIWRIQVKVDDSTGQE